jgi:hypothetical protein
MSKHSKSISRRMADQGYGSEDGDHVADYISEVNKNIINDFSKEFSEIEDVGDYIYFLKKGFEFANLKLLDKSIRILLQNKNRFTHIDDILFKICYDIEIDYLQQYKKYFNNQLNYPNFQENKKCDDYHSFNYSDHGIFYEIIKDTLYSALMDGDTYSVGVYLHFIKKDPNLIQKRSIKLAIETLKNDRENNLHNWKNMNLRIKCIDKEIAYFRKLYTLFK